ncbi:MAG: GHKL domain-containing protein [SAR324 cluster bacterium]|nr:GHKL domain-containing protein [SAR324 cluster bacterium]
MTSHTFSSTKVNIRNAVATKILKVVFSFYLIMAIALTGMHMVVEFYRAKDGVIQELTAMQKMFESGLAQVVWDGDMDQLQTMIQGMYDSPSIMGVKLVADILGSISKGSVKDENGNVVTQETAEKQTSLNPSEMLSQLFGYEFPLIYQDGTTTEKIANVTLYSSADVVFQKVRMGFVFIVLMAVLKTSVLWVIFYYCIQYFLTRPLSTLTAAAEKLTLDNPENINLNLPTSEQNELKILEDSFNFMIQQNTALFRSLKESEEKYRLLSEELEHRVKERTFKLEESLDTLQKTQNQLIVQEKLASLGSMTAGISHELKNPLHLANNFAEQCVLFSQEIHKELEKQSENWDKEEIYNLLSMIERSAMGASKHGKRADRIIQTMLLHSRGQEGEWQLTGINELLKEYMDLSFHSMRAKSPAFHVTVESEFDDSIGQIMVVPQDLCRVFLNIMDNALYAAHKKSAEQNGDFMPRVKAKTKNLGHQIEIRIWDNGKGISPENKDKIFEPFYTTKPTGEGTGLGLSLSYEIIVQEHQGSLRMQSEPGEYTEFILVIPSEK